MTEDSHCLKYGTAWLSARRNPLKTLCRFARDNGLSGLEFAYGIPGTVGGAVYMNAGAYDGQISGVLEWAEAVTPNGRYAVSNLTG